MLEPATPLRRLVLLALTAALLLGGSVVAQEPDCGGYDRTIMFAGLDWDSAQLHNEIARTILEEGFGCDTDAIPGSSIPMLQGVVRGDVQVNMEVWVDNLPEWYTEAVERGTVQALGPNFPDATQGWFVPRYLVEGDAERGIEALAPDLRSVEDLAEHAELFRDPEQPDKGRFYNCIIGWVCEEINNAKFAIYDLDEHFTNFRPGTGVALASSMEGAYLRGEPWVGYYWGPTWVLGKLDMIQLEEPEWTEACWSELQTELADASQACHYPVSLVRIDVNARFAERVGPEIIDFLTKYETDNALVSELLAYMQESESDAREAAEHFLATRPEVWTGWVPEDVAERVQASLQ